MPRLSEMDKVGKTVQLSREHQRLYMIGLLVAGNTSPWIDYGSKVCRCLGLRQQDVKEILHGQNSGWSP